MKIARIRHLFYPDMPKDYFYELSAKQAKFGDEVHVVSWNKNKTLAEFKSDGFFIHRLNGLNFSLPGSFQDYPYLPNLSSVLKQIDSDIVHCESHLFLPSLQALRIAKKFGCPYVVTVHGVYASRGFAVDCVQKTYLRSVSGFFKEADRIICLTKDDASEISKYGFSSEKIRIVSNGVDTERFKPGYSKQVNLIVWSGRFVPEKGVYYLIEAAWKLSKQNVAAKFLLIGYGPLKKKLELLAFNYGLLGRTVFFSEGLKRDEISKILSEATIFVFPSLKEGLPISILEAASSAVAIVASDIPGINTVVEHEKSGLLVKAMDSSAIADSVLRLLNNEELRRKLGQNARELVITRFSWAKVLPKLEEVYLEAINVADGGRHFS